MAEEKKQNDIVKLVNVSEETLKDKKSNISFKCNGVLYTVKLGEALRVFRSVAEHGLKTTLRHINDGAGTIAKAVLKIEELPIDQRNPNVFNQAEAKSLKSDLEKANDEIKRLNEQIADKDKTIEKLQKKIEKLEK